MPCRICQWHILVFHNLYTPFLATPLSFQNFLSCYLKPSSGVQSLYSNFFTLFHHSSCLGKLRVFSWDSFYFWWFLLFLKNTHGSLVAVWFVYASVAPLRLVCDPSFFPYIHLYLKLTFSAMKVHGRNTWGKWSTLVSYFRFHYFLFCSSSLHPQCLVKTFMTSTCISTLLFYLTLMPLP